MPLFTTKLTSSLQSQAPFKARVLELIVSQLPIVVKFTFNNKWLWFSFDLLFLLTIKYSRTLFNLKVSKKITRFVTFVIYFNSLQQYFHEDDSLAMIVITWNNSSRLVPSAIILCIRIWSLLNWDNPDLSSIILKS